MKTKLIPLRVFATVFLLAIAFVGRGASVSGSNTGNVTIPDAGGYVSSTIAISSAPAGSVVTSIDVYFKCTHTFSGDLTVDLNADSTGSLGNRNLWNREGGSADNPTRTTTGITTFNGLSVNRTWYLYAKDFVAGDSGYIDEWTITINYSTPNTTPTYSLANQYRTDTGAAIPLNGGVVPTGVGVNFKANVSDADGDTVKYEVELHQLPATFTGVATHSSGFVSSGSQATTTTASGLAAGNYGWKFRVVDSRGAANAWSSAGNPDFVVQAVNQTPTYSLANQYRTDTGAGIPLNGGIVPTGVGVNFKANVSDADGDTVKYEVELHQLPATFTGVATHSSGFVSSGSQAATTTASGLAAGNYGWKFRVVDDRGAANAWSSAGNPDFVVQAANQTPTYSLANQYRTDTGAAIPLNGGVVPTGVGVNFKANVSDADGDTVKYEVELHQLPATFTGVATHSSGFVSSGSQATTTTASGLAAGNYGWKFRVVDDRGAANAWSSVGNPDFVVQGVANQTPTYSLANQHRTDTGAAIPLNGGIVPVGVGVNFTANVSDADGDTIKYEVELHQLPATFTGVATHSSGFVSSGSQATTTTASGLAAGNYGWKFRVVDNRGAARNWSSAGNPDFIVQSTGVTPSITSVSPASPVGSSSRQSFTINGINFQSGASVTLRDLTASQTFTDRPISSQSSSHITINPLFTTAAHNWSVEVINPNATSGQFPFSVQPPQSQSLSTVSPVVGRFRVTGTENSSCLGIAELWTFCQHQTDFHRPGGGIAGSDDTLAWDINLLNDADAGLPVYAVAAGRVVRYAGLHAPGAVSGSLLIEHTQNGVTWWSGYLHMKDIQVAENQDVTPSTLLGRISNVCPSCGSIPNHLHFVAYEGANTQGGLISRQVQFIERPQFAEVGKVGTQSPQSGQFQLGISAPLQDEVMVQATEDFHNWTDVSIVPITDGKGVFTDPNAGSYQKRFYYPKP